MTDLHRSVAESGMTARISSHAMALLLAVALSASVQAGDTPPADHYAADVVTLFATACLRHYPDPADFTRWVRQDGVKPLPAAMAHKLTKDPQGRAYSIALDDTRVIVATRHDNLCTLYVKRVDTKAARRALAPLRRGLTESGQLTEHRSQHQRNASTGQLLTTGYTYTRRDGHVALQLTVSTSTSTRGFYQLAMSASMATRQSPTGHDVPVPARGGG